MKGVTLSFKNGDIAIADLPTPNVGTRSVLVANHHSLISNGTEGYIVRMSSKGPIGKALDCPDLAKQVIQRALTDGFWNTTKVVRNLISAPLPLGYSCAGEIIATGPQADPFTTGDRVACAGLGVANHAEHVSVPITMMAKLPDEVSTQDAAFGTIGAIALHSARLANPELGEVFAVIGLGLIGQLVAQILTANGCQVIGIDLDPKKVSLALDLGMTAGAVTGRDDVDELVNAFTGGRGVDGVLLCAHSKSSDPLLMAADISRVRGRIVAVGLINLDVPRREFFEKELRLEVSRAYGAGAYDTDYERKGHDYPFAYVRWTEGRNLGAFIELLASGRVKVGPLITHRYSLEDAPKAYELITGERKEPHIGILIGYDAPSEATPTINLKALSQEPLRGDPTALGVIGAGRFAQAVLLPGLVDQGMRICAVATGAGLSAQHVAKKYNAHLATTDYREVLAHEEVSTVLIATRHTLHAEVIQAAIAAGKNIFVEKPLAVTPEEVASIKDALKDYRGTFLVGFNRRFSPACKFLTTKLRNRHQPLTLTHRFLIPMITKGHESDWVHDPEAGGSRIIGEVCHMVDTAAFLIGSPVTSVFARAINGGATDISNYDTVMVTLGYADGSVAQLQYLANSDASVPQERLEVHWEGHYAEVDNFRKGFSTRKGRRSRFWHLNQQKGWSNEIKVFSDSIRNGMQYPIPLESLIETTHITFAIHESIEKSRVVLLSPGDMDGGPFGETMRAQ